MRGWASLGIADYVEWNVVGLVGQTNDVADAYISACEIFSRTIFISSMSCVT
jgi:hypothetical protein